MRIKDGVACAGIACLFILAGLTGCIEQPEPTGVLIVLPSTRSYENPKYAIASYYSSDEITIDHKVPQYHLPLSANDVINFGKIKQYFQLSSEEETFLFENGFVIVDYGDTDDIIQPYKTLKEDDIPIFITTDTLLHLYHVQFDEILKSIEERIFFDDVLDLTIALLHASKKAYMEYSDGLLKEAARRNVAYFAVGLVLLQTSTKDYNGSEDIREVDFTIPSYVQEVSEEIELIESHTGFAKSPIFHYEEDYSQYVPRGHYTRSEKLKRYFKTMTWYGRIAFLLKGGDPYCSGCPFLISEEDSKIQTTQASLISTLLPNLKVKDVTAGEIWNRIYSVTSFFVGAADDLTPYEYLDSITQVFGLKFNAEELVNETKLFALKLKLAEIRSPEIYGGTGRVEINPLQVSKEKLYQALDKTKGMRFMGQRFTPDSYIFQQLVFPKVGSFTGEGKPFTLEYTGAGRPRRCFPRGLDLMAVLGSKRALEILEGNGDAAYENYSGQLAMLIENFSKINISGWNRNLYWSWIYTLKSLLEVFDERYPTFMRQKTWLDKELQTALSSWTQLRHDTILYVKQSYTIVEVSIPPPPEETIGYVEPVPEFYSRLLALTKMTREGLNSLNVLSELEITRLRDLEDILIKILEITKDILENKPYDYEFIRNFGGYIEETIEGIAEKGQRTTIVADVHTDSNTQHCLEEAVGYIDFILVAYMVPEGDIVVGGGPVLSYYEFKQPIDSRLTDEEWRDILEKGEEPPKWIKKDTCL